jgi:hypothetical protein
MKTDELLNGILAKDETVKWTATPQPYSIMNEENKRATVMFWIIATAVLLILNIAYIALCAADDAVDFKIGVLIVTVGIPVFLYINPLRDEMYIAKQLLVITNTRVMICHKSGKELHIDIENIKTVSLEKSADAERCHIKIGAAVDAPTGKLRKIAVSGKHDNDDKCTGLVFYHMDTQDGKRAHELIKSIIG